MTTRLRVAVLAALVLAPAFAGVFVPARAAVDKAVLDAQAERVKVIDKVRGSVVAVFAPGAQGGGSGVLITKDGYALTNFHVVAAMLANPEPVMECGLADGVLYDAILVGLDRVGDVALIKLLPKEKGKDFPYSEMADSDQVRAGDWSLAMGNPFLLATDFTPTVTFGLVSGVHRYQYPEGKGLLEYTDCIQIDTSINPGNSGGPLFNMKGEVIGINGRGSFDKRSRINSGVGYAISINQIKNFLGHLRAGLDTDHATLGANVKERDEDGGLGKLAVAQVLESSDAYRRGLRSGDELVSFAWRRTDSPNTFKNILGIYPKGWRVPIEYRSQKNKGDRTETLVRLMKLTREGKDDKPAGPRPGPAPAKSASPAAKFFEKNPKKTGFANWYFNKLEMENLFASFKKGHGDFAPAVGDWEFATEAQIKKAAKADTKLTIREESDDRDAAGRPVIRDWTFHLRADRLLTPPGATTEDQEKLALRPAVRKVHELLRKHATDLPQIVWAGENEQKTKEQVAKQRKDVQEVRTALKKAIDDLKAADKERNDKDKDEFVTTVFWRAHYDYALARAIAFLAYVTEYDAMLEQIEKAPPALGKNQRGWRLEAAEKVTNDPARQFAEEAENLWKTMNQAKEYKGSEVLAQAKKGWPDKLGLTIKPTGATKTIVRVGDKYSLDPLKIGQELDMLAEPFDSGGFLMALYQYKRFLTLGEAGFEGGFFHGGWEPFYLPVDGKTIKDRKVDTQVIQTEHAAVTCKWYFSKGEDCKLLGFETFLSDTEDPCEVYLSDYKAVDGRQVPHKFEVVYKGERYGTYTVKSCQMASTK